MRCYKSHRQVDVSWYATYNLFSPVRHLGADQDHHGSNLSPHYFVAVIVQKLTLLKHLRCDGAIFSDIFIVNSLPSVPVKVFWKSQYLKKLWWKLNGWLLHYFGHKCAYMNGLQSCFSCANSSLTCFRRSGINRHLWTIMTNCHWMRTQWHAHCFTDHFRRKLDQLRHCHINFQSSVISLFEHTHRMGQNFAHLH